MGLVYVAGRLFLRHLQRVVLRECQGALPLCLLRKGTNSHVAFTGPNVTKGAFNARRLHSSVSVAGVEDISRAVGTKDVHLACPCVVRRNHLLRGLRVRLGFNVGPNCPRAAVNRLATVGRRGFFRPERVNVVFVCRDCHVRLRVDWIFGKAPSLRG